MVEKKNNIKILVTGAGGLLGSCLTSALSDKYIVKGIGRSDCDITDAKKVKEVLIRESPRVVIHAAALTDVDACEKDPRSAFNINAEGTRNIAQACAGSGTVLIFISTDYVFDGTKLSAYTEDDEPKPINVYAQSKFEAEKICAMTLKEYLIIRTSWLFGARHKDFVDTVIKKIRQGADFNIIGDKYSIPTYSVDLSGAIAGLIGMLCGGRGGDLRGVYHITNSGKCSWYEFALKIKEFYGHNGVNISSTKLDEYGFAAKRPRCTVLENKRFARAAGYRLRPWQEALKEYIEKCYVN